MPTEAALPLPALSRDAARSLAAALALARRDGEQIDRRALADLGSEADAYAVQALAFELGGPPRIAAWKIGGTNTAAQSSLGLRGPFFAPVAHAEVYDAKTPLPVRTGHGPVIETEIAIRLATDLPPGTKGYTPRHIAAAIDTLHPAFELVGCRVSGGPAGLGLAAIADGGLNAAVVIGPALPSLDHTELEACRITLSAAGTGQPLTHRAAGSFGDLIWSQGLVDALGWLANHPQRRWPLLAGQYVLTGTCTGVLPLVGLTHLRADFGGLGHLCTSLMRPS